MKLIHLVGTIGAMSVTHQAKSPQLTDADIARMMAAIPHSMMLGFMQKHGDLIKDDSNYWNLLGTAWKAGGSFEFQDQWIELFKAKRRSRQKIMKTSERREFSKLPKLVTAYRCCDDEIEQFQSICWSLDKKFVDEYAEKNGRTLIFENKFAKDDIFAYFNRRGESEILVWRGQA